MKLSEKRAYVGSLDQLVRVTPYRMEGGRAEGVRAADVCNETGLRLTVVADRCMDIADLSFRGVNIGYRNACGVVAPAYYDKEGTNWLRSFTAGFLTTCGLYNTGSPNVVNGVAQGLHGRIGHTPAREFCARVETDGETARAVLSGAMDESVIFGENLQLHRTIVVEGERNVLTIRDRVCNEGFRPEAYMQLYHFNIGYPFLSPACELVLPAVAPMPRNEWAAQHIGTVSAIEAPSQGDEMCYYYKLPEDAEIGSAGLYNRELEIGMLMSFDAKPLKRFVQWKNLASGCYVLGLEPGTNFVDGRTCEEQRDTLPVLEAQSWEEHTVQIEFFAGRPEFDAAVKRLQQ